MPLMDGKAKQEGITAKDVDPKQLAKGIRAESEHTKAKWLARTIAMDHLAEIPDYYTRLEKMEGEAKRAYTQSYIQTMVKLATLSDTIRRNPHVSSYADPLGLVYPTAMADGNENPRLKGMLGAAVGALPGSIALGESLSPLAKELLIEGPELGNRLALAARSLSGKQKAMALIGTLLATAGSAEGQYQALAPHSAFNDWRASKLGIIDRIKHHFA